jgi:hypothetical protein
MRESMGRGDGWIRGEWETVTEIRSAQGEGKGADK